MFDRLLDLINDVPIGTVIFLGVLLWSFLGRKSNESANTPRPRRPQVPSEPSIYASDERRTRERNEWGHLDFGTPDDRYGDANEWGQTEYGFESTEWGSTFDEDRDDRPRIR